MRVAWSPNCVRVREELLVSDEPRYRVGEAGTPTYEAPPTRPVTEPERVSTLCRGLARLRVEVFQVLLLDARHHLIRKVTVSRGSLNASIVHPREVFRPAIVASAGAILLVHNHPSGHPEPSRDDLELTKRLVRAGELLGIPVLDHIIIVKSGYLSLRREGHLG